METDYIRRFVVVGQTLNFRKSADMLFISQPTLSHSISKLEEQLGLTLLNRNTKTVSLTPAGERFFDLSVEFLEHFDNYEKNINSIAEQAKPNKNLIRIGYMGHSVDGTLTPWLKEFHKDNPQIEFQIVSYHDASITSALENHEIHLALLFSEYIKDTSRLNYELVMKERFQLVVGSQHPLACERSVTMSQIAAEPLILCKRSAAPYYYDRILQLFTQSGLTPNIHQEVDQMGDIFRMISIGMGAGILSFSGDNYYRRYDLSFVDIEGIDNHYHDKMLAWDDSNLTPAASKLISFIRSIVNQ